MTSPIPPAAAARCREVVRWRSYAEDPPATAGVYRWRVKSRTLKDSFVTFDAHMRKRWASYQEALSPSFDHWDGYRIIVPDGMEWGEASDATLKDHCFGQVAVENLDIAACPFCARTPQLHGVVRYANGVAIGGEPFNYNTWWLECCEWARTPHVDNLLKMVADRNAKLSALHRPAVSVERLRALQTELSVALLSHTVVDTKAFERAVWDKFEALIAEAAQ